MKFNLNDYEPVEDRIKRFYADHEDGRITAELLSDPNNIGTVVVKAHLFLGAVEVASGLAYEKAGEGYVNKTSHLENCETSAIGRALANFNYAGNKRPSREEMTKVQQDNGELIEALNEIADGLDLTDDERTKHAAYLTKYKNNREALEKYLNKIKQRRDDERMDEAADYGFVDDDPLRQTKE